MRVLLVDDHAVVRAGFRRILEDERDAPFVGEAINAAIALEQLETGTWDVVVLDISLPGRGGLELLVEIHDRYPSCRVLMMTMHSEDQYAVRAFRAGASGYITKDAPPQELVAAVRKVHTGGRYVTAALGERLAELLSQGPAATPHDALSNRELQVLKLIGAGRSVKDIGTELNLSEKTISTYRTRVLEKLNLHTTADLIRYAISANLAE